MKMIRLEKKKSNFILKQNENLNLSQGSIWFAERLGRLLTLISSINSSMPHGRRNSECHSSILSTISRNIQGNHIEILHSFLLKYSWCSTKFKSKQHKIEKKNFKKIILNLRTLFYWIPGKREERYIIPILHINMHLFLWISFLHPKALRLYLLFPVAFFDWLKRKMNR